MIEQRMSQAGARNSGDPRPRRSVLFLCMAVPGALLSGPSVGHAQTSRDSLSVYEHVLRGWAEGPSISHPSGRVEAFCLETLPEWIRFTPGRDPPPLLPGHAEAVAGWVETNLGLARAEGCRVPEGSGVRGWMVDGENRPAILLLVSGLVFEDEDAALIHVGTLAGTLWGGGSTCRWVRFPNEARWREAECPTRWAS